MFIRIWSRLAVLATILAAPQEMFAKDAAPTETQPADSKPAEGKPAQKDPAELFAELDKNGDGKLTTDEVSAGQKRFFEHLLRVAGKEKDGALTKEEFVQGFKPDDLKVTAPPNSLGLGSMGPGGLGGPFNPVQLFQRFDRNRDGKLALDEIPEQGRGRFQPLFDRLGKKEITREEFVGAMEQLSRGGPGGGFLRDAAGRPALLSDIQALIFRKLDTNSDRKLSKAEWEKAGALFEDLDRNNNGSIEPDELFGPPHGAERAPTGNGRPAASPATDSPAVKPREAKNPGAADSPASAADSARLNVKSPGSEKVQSTLAGVSGARNARRLMALQGKGSGPGQRLDANGDGKISRDEARGRLKEKFDTIDKNDDGFLTRDEMRAALRQFRAK